MNILASFKTELIKLKRSAALWVVVLGAGFVPFIFLLSYLIKPVSNIKRLGNNPWAAHVGELWQAFSIFLLPMFIILICSLVLQIEYKNNTWKQVYASPQSYANIFFSKLGGIITMILLLFVLFNVFALGAAIIPNLFYKGFKFLATTFNWQKFMVLNIRLFISTLGIIAFQYWLSMRFKNFIVPIGIGLACLIATLIAMRWEHIFKIPYAHPFLTMQFGEVKKGFLQNHEWNSIGYFIVFTALGFLDMRLRKERG
ncbi:MAG: ABC transporter permease [Sphingobacteriales bacterium]|nr:ABC transporter permease [Sphingobacteriales bacterium]